MKTDENLSAVSIAKMLNHSILRPDMTETEVADDCAMARRLSVASVCVRPCDVVFCRERLKGSDVRISAVVGFPHGSSAPDTKVFEACRAMDDGAQELDMVLAIGKVRSGAWDYVEKDIKGVIDAAHARGVIVKVIFEDCFLTDEEVKASCALSERLAVDFVKTSTGYGPGGATAERVRLMRASCSTKVGVKAAGGIRTLDQFLKILAAGAAQQGTRSTKAIMEEALAREREGVLTRVPRE